MSKIIVSQLQNNALAPEITLPTTAPTAGQLIVSDALGNLSFSNTLPPAATATDITASGTISANALTSSTTVSGTTLVAPYIKSTPSSATFTLPAVDGAAGTFLQTNGSGLLSFQNVTVSLSGASNPTTSTAAAAGIVYANTNSLQYFVCMGSRIVSGSTVYMWVGSQGTAIGFPQGQQAFTTPGTTTWTAPPAVYSVCVVCVGGGGGGYSSWSNPAGSGGGLGWKNSISVTPGTSYTVVVGAGGAVGNNAGGNSYFIDLSTVAGYGGGNVNGANTGGPNSNSTYGGGWVGDGGGAGGYANNYQGGGGAGGYTGRGGNGGGAYSGASAYGLGGGGGAGGYYSSTYGTGAGGGVGILGQGASGASGYSVNNSYAYGGRGGSGGANGGNGEPIQAGPNAITGGAYGGGGGGSGTSYGGGAGGDGAVRIIWGAGRAFPSTNTGDVTPVN